MTSTGGGFTSGFRTIKSGYLNKRCRWSWRPRYVELISNPKDMTGPHFRCLLLIYDHSSRYVKNKIRVDDIVTVRSGKTYSFQIYLNNGMFLFFRTGSLDNQSAWMADLKMALGKVTSQFHVRVHVAAPSSCKALVLDHALLYCIGVNLPTHHSGQLDRVLVLASPVTDVNLHAWNLSRVKRLIVMEIGIQMELCSNCSGCHEKKVVMFLLPSDLIEDCMNFLLHEMQASDLQPQRSEPNDPIIYVLPHQCGGARSGSFSFSPHQQQPKQQQSYDSAILKALNSHPASNAPLPADVSPKKDPPAVSPNPVLPPRNQLRPNYQEYIDAGGAELKSRHVSSSRSHAPVRYRHDHFDVPYHISQRIYINDTGTIRHESQVLGSGSGEFRANNGSSSQVPRVIVTESSQATGYNPVYISTDDIHPGPTSAGHSRSPGPNKSMRPEFIGRRRPMLPPRSSDILEDVEPPPPPHSFSPLPARTPPPPTSTSPRSSPSPPLTPPLPARSPPSPPPSYSQDDPETGSGYVNVEDTRCTSALSLCTDDITNADFALMTKVTFKNIIPALPPRSNKQPVPTPRKQQSLHKTQNTPSSSVVSTQQSSSEYSYASAPFYGIGIGGYSSVVHQTDLKLERPRSQSSGSLCLNQLYDRTMHHGKVSNEC